MIVIEQLIAQIVHFIACKLLFSQQTDVVRQRSTSFAFLTGKREIRHHGKPKAVNEVRPYCTVFLHGDNISDRKGMPAEILRVVNIETLVNIIERFVLLQSAAINTVIILTVDIHSVFFQMFAVGEVVITQLFIIFELINRIPRLGKRKQLAQAVAVMA